MAPEALFTRLGPGPRRWLVWLALGVLGVSAVTVLGRIPPSHAGERSLCLFRRWLFPCPGCGSLRSLAAIGRGEPGAAWVLHPLIPLVLAEVVGLWLVSGVRRAGRQGERRPGGGSLADRPRSRRGRPVSGASTRSRFVSWWPPRRASFVGRLLGRSAVRRSTRAGAAPGPDLRGRGRGSTETGSRGAAGGRKGIPESVPIDLLLFAHGAAFLALWIGRTATGSLPW